MNINDKLDELIELLDNNKDIKKIDEIKKRITDNEITLINNYRMNPTVSNKKLLYDNEVICEYLLCENKINYLIMEINNKFKRRDICESHKW